MFILSAFFLTPRSLLQSRISLATEIPVLHMIPDIFEEAEGLVLAYELRAHDAKQLATVLKVDNERRAATLSNLILVPLIRI